ncbi:MAG: response regulator [Pirellulales bacterium]|nr:response regulator [Pirellulales bacterium]
MNFVLLVEGKSLNRMVIEDLFEYDEIPATLFSVESGERAIELARRRKPLLVLIDLELPGLSGLDTMRRLKGDPQTRDIPVWAISAYAMRGDAAQTVSAGFDACVAKPIDTKQFAEQIRQFMANVPHPEASSCTAP